MRATYVADASVHYFSMTSEAADTCCVITITSAAAYWIKDLIVTEKVSSDPFEIVVYAGIWNVNDVKVPGADDPLCIAHFYSGLERLMMNATQQVESGFYHPASSAFVEDTVSVALIPPPGGKVAAGVRIAVASS